MEHEEKDKAERSRVQYRDTLFAHAFVNGNPELFEKLYPEVFGVDEESIEWITDPLEFEDFLANEYGITPDE